ncbi:MAG: hypothetical protein Tsb0032_35780 [Kiloniellaceae bacterium]
MKEDTDKASQKSGKAAPKGARPGKARSPESRQATAPGEGSAAGKESGQPASSSLAPDPATITFGSNRPIVATPTKVPEGSGLRFSGPSLGELKASGPQPSSAKASGLTFTSAKNGSGATGSGKSTTSPAKGASAKDAAPAGTAQTGPARTDGKTPGASKDAGKGDDTTADKKATGKAATDKHAADKKPADRNAAEKSGTESGASKVPPSGGKTPAKPAPLTKPAIAPQQSGRRLDKERSSSGFALTLMALVAVVGGLAYWMNWNDQSAAPGPEIAATAPEAARPAAGEAARAAELPAVKPPAAAVSPGTTEVVRPLGPSPRAPESPGPLAGEAPTKMASVPPAKSPALSGAEIIEIQKLLDNLGLGPGNLDGVVSAETTAAIRAYQEMAGLPASGVADQALLDELRSVAELYGG